MRARRLACRCWAGRVALRENRAPTHRLTAPRQSEAGRSAVPWRAPRPRRVALLGTARSRRAIVPSTHLAREGRMTVTIGRRELLAALSGAAAAWPLAPRAHQPAMPEIGFLAEGAPDSEQGALTAFRQGLREAGYVEGQNVQIDYRWTGNQRDLVLALTADLVRREVTVIYSARGSAVAQAAKSATTTIPIVFTNGGDPVKLGLVASLNRPGGNVTGTTFFSNVLTAKRLTLLRDLMPSAVDVAVLINPTNANADTDRDELQAAAQAPGLRLKLLPATNEKEIDAAF